jgi:macrolide transport system ATP-binding/permease protein
MDNLRSDLRFAIRALLARPGFSALAILTLAIGLGVNAVAFSAVNALLYKPLRFPDVETLGWIQTRSPGNPYSQTSLPDYQDLARSARSFDSIAAEGRMPLSMYDGKRTRQIWALLVSGNYFSTLRATPEIGRVFTDADRSSSDAPAVVSARFWSSELGGGDSVAGRTLTLNGRLVSVVGVLPDGFQGPGGLYEPDVWIPIDRRQTLNMAARLSERSQPWLTLVGRVLPGVSAAQAGAELQNVAAGLAAEHPVADPAAEKQRTLIFTPMADGNPEVRTLAPFAWIGLAIVGLVLLIACFNVAALLLARASDRQRETSVRTALGASRSRIVRQFAVEGLMLALVSGAAAVVVAGWSADLLSAFSLPSPIPQRLHIVIDRRLIGFTVMLVAFAGVVPALLPALQATRVNLVASMRMDSVLGPRRSRLRNVFMVAQIAGSTLFLTTALLFVRSFWTQVSTNPGFETAHLLVLELKPSDFNYDAARSQVLFENLVERVRGLPGIERVALGDRIPFYVGFPKATKVSADGTDCATVDCRDVYVYGIGPGYMAALGVAVVSGQEFSAQEMTAGDNVIVSQKLAARLWPGRAAVGEWIREGRSGRQLRVIGVAADVKHHMLGETPREYLYRPLLSSEYGDTVTLIVRTSGDPGMFLSAVQDQVRALDASLPPGSVKTMEQRMEMPLWPARTAAGFLGVCGALALILATVGLFGLTYLTVSQRTREFGIRAALGATPQRVMRQVLREGIWLTLPGVLLGLGGAAVAGRLLSSGLVGVNAADPSSYAASASLQATVALLACLLPAYRATRVDPMLALRVD